MPLLLISGYLSFSVFRESYPRLSSVIPHLCMLKNAYSWGESWLLNAQITRTVIWISSWSFIIFTAAAAWLRSWRALHGALVTGLVGRRIAGASFCTLTCQRRGRLMMLIGGAGTILPCCWRRSVWRLLPWHSLPLPRLISFDEASPAGLVLTKHRCTLQVHYVAIEVAQHLGKIIVKLVSSEIWFHREWLCDIIYKVPVQYRCFGSQRLQRHRVWEGVDSKGLDVCNTLELDKACWHCCCPDGRKAACHDGLDSLTYEITVGWRSLQAPAQFIATKPGEEARTWPAEYLDASAIMSKGQYSFEA